MRCSREDPGHERVATLDIETTHYDAAKGEVVSVGLGVHRRGEPADAATYETLHRDGRGEAALLGRATECLDGFDADCLVTFNGQDFDLPFLSERLAALGTSVQLPDVATSAERHLDLFEERKRAADRDGSKWPSLEECLEAYDLPRPVTRWREEPLTNVRFGEELGPAYLAAVEGSPLEASALAAVIDHYLVTDLEANLALFYADVGIDFEPQHLGTSRAF